MYHAMQTSKIASRDDLGPFSTERARSTVAICVIFLILATIAVAARFWARRIKGMKPALDDWLVVISLVFYYLSAIQTVLQVGIGRLGHHLDGGITPDQLIKMGKVRPNTAPFCVDGRSDSVFQAGHFRTIRLRFHNGLRSMVDLFSTISHFRYEGIASAQ